MGFGTEAAKGVKMGTGDLHGFAVWDFMECEETLALPIRNSSEPPTPYMVAEASVI